MTDSKKRFSSRVEDYEKYRPSYPESLLNKLFEITGSTSKPVVADIGSGTGIFTELLLEHGVTVTGVEPNDDMRNAAEKKLSVNTRFSSQNGSAEKTGLKSDSVDLITAAQAFHWFNNDETKAEFARILNHNGWLALIWNDRKYGEGCQAVYEDVLKKYGTDYSQVNHQNLTEEQIASFFAGNKMDTYSFVHTQEFDFEGVLGRLRSCSYSPDESTQDYKKAVEEIKVAFDQYSVNGKVPFEYDSKLYIGKIQR
ncbi:methyltransferase domain-containing protein [Vibrio sp. S4M6]|uniref:class I SAM-dependent methyltransferase n=1 Tax=Vibrio sinus TaxID=2946865 RepID=UPI00202A6074|nr:class I SAM-dependent methyltransferase [Vibrio sinus]MCL9783317.1 methyltransferase domain-containing protein [Vibrio sinus]